MNIPPSPNEQDLFESKLTAYALGELSSAERTEMETLISQKPELQKEVEKIQSFGHYFSRNLKTPADFHLTPEQKEKIKESASQVSPSREKNNRWRKWSTSLVALSACIALAMIVTQPKISNALVTAKNAQPQSVKSKVDEAKMKSSASETLPSTPEIEQNQIEQPVAIASASGDVSDISETPPAPAPFVDTNTSLEGIASSISKMEASKSALSSDLLSAFVSRERRNSTPLSTGDIQVVSETWSAPAASEAGSNQGYLSQAFIAKSKARFPSTSTTNESYDHVVENDFQKVTNQPLSTLSVDVDTASYSNIRRFINSGQLPPRDSVRIEEMLNYFTYSYPQPETNHPFSVTTEVTECPWQKDHQLMRVGIKGREVAKKDRPQANLVFLIDVSGSMSSPNKLPLVQQSLKLMTQNLKESDRVAITVYAGGSGLVLPSTPVEKRHEIIHAIESLTTEGGTNGAMGIQLAYDIAKANFIPEGINRVILCTDGDFNVGITNQGDLIQLIEEKAKSGVFLSVFGFGMGNYKDSILEKLADKGNGNYAYIDSEKEAKRNFVERLSGNLQTIAKDVKIQIEFNPAHLIGYRLLGYENRLLAAQDFNNDKKDAGEIGAGHTVTALYELIPVGKPLEEIAIDPLKYQKNIDPSPSTLGLKTKELLTIKLRYKQPDGEKSSLLEFPVKADDQKKWTNASKDTHFAAAVASFGMLLRDSKLKGTPHIRQILEMAEEGTSRNQEDRLEFISLLEKTQKIADGKK